MGKFSKWAILGLFFLHFRLFNTVDSKLKLPMTGFKPRISGSEATALPTEPMVNFTTIFVSYL